MAGKNTNKNKSNIEQYWIDQRRNIHIALTRTRVQFGHYYLNREYNLSRNKMIHIHQYVNKVNGDTTYSVKEGERQVLKVVENSPKQKLDIQIFIVDDWIMYLDQEARDILDENSTQNNIEIYI